jgi:hypothetical protein
MISFIGWDCRIIFRITLWLFNIAMGNGPFIEVYLAMLNNQMVIIELE